MLFTTHGQPLVERAAEQLTAIIIASWPLVPRTDAELLSECLVRLAISYAALPTGPASMTAASIATLLGPYVERLVQPGRRQLPGRPAPHWRLRRLASRARRYSLTTMSVSSSTEVSAVGLSSAITPSWIMLTRSHASRTWT